MKDNVDACLPKSPTVKQVVVLKRTGQKIAMQPGRDHWWHEITEFRKTTLQGEKKIPIVASYGSLAASGSARSAGKVMGKYLWSMTVRLSD